MKRNWQEKNPALFAQIHAEVIEKYPTLHLAVGSRIVHFDGAFQIRDGKGVFDYFFVEIFLPANFPDDLPIVREVGGRIPETANRHLLRERIACLHVQDEWYYSHPNGYSLCEFLDGPVRSFFIGQICVENGRPWPGGERAHGTDGILQCYMDLTNAPDIATARTFLSVLGQGDIKGHHRCPCGSGEKVRHCHKQLLNVKDKIPLQVRKRTWQSIIGNARHSVMKR